MILKNAKQLSNLRLCAALFLRVTRALGTFCGSRTSSISNPLFLRMWWHPIFPVYWCACVCLCAFVCAYLCAGKQKKKNGVDADSAGREVLHEHAVVVAMLIIFTEFFVFVYLLLFFYTSKSNTQQCVSYVFVYFLRQFLFDPPSAAFASGFCYH